MLRAIRERKISAIEEAAIAVPDDVLEDLF